MSKIQYDTQSKILRIQLSKRKSVDSDWRDNIVMDYDKNGDVVNIDIMNISLLEFKKMKQRVGNALPVYERMLR
ncbi:DUF2283 domain-containing protein [Candidatus Uhrbacteria bacterium]|nr:DUF2283 domain-containing protein [Candidatus Uhrbacteria bacterium]